jgi:phosphatidylserine/phosphatidylglycerophosphate/cardiolipin synthase-like enzyme
MDGKMELKNFLKLLTAILISLLIITACGGGETDNNSTYTQDELNSEYVEQIYMLPLFSKTSGAYYDGGVDQIIVQDIKRAKRSIELAMYDFTNRDIKDALIEAKNRGVEVRVVTDDNKIEDEVYQELILNGIKVVNDNDSSKLMHNKFLIIDDNILWTGSANYTVFAFYRNYENLIKFESRGVASIYKKEFENLYINSDKNYTGGAVGDVVSIYFSPDSDFEEKLIKEIDKAKESINFLAFSFTNRDIADALIRAKDRGVEVKGIFDENQNNFQSSSVYEYLNSSGVEVHLSTKNKLHSKVMIMDNQRVITGSYNFSKSANDENNENSVIVSHTTVANQYTKNFFNILEDIQALEEE